MSDFLEKADELYRKGQVDEFSQDFKNVFEAISNLQTVHSKAELDLDNIESVFADFVVPISQEAEIFTEYILPEGAPEEEVYGRMYFDDKEIKTGRKEISFEEIKVEDNVYITLTLKPDYTVEGTKVEVSPQDLFENL